MIWTGVTQFRLCHNIEYAQYTLQCMVQIAFVLHNVDVVDHAGGMQAKAV